MNLCRIIYFCTFIINNNQQTNEPKTKLFYAIDRLDKSNV